MTTFLSEYLWRAVAASLPVSGMIAVFCMQLAYWKEFRKTESDGQMPSDRE